MKDLRYRGEFATYNGHAVRVELWQETAAPYARVGKLEFPAEEPLSIEWEAVDKLEPVERSHATLRVISPGDRTYEDLWTDSAGSVRMDVYIDDRLNWSGTMDAEQYAEPYERLSGYEVELTFGDFGVLDRKKYIEHGVKSLGWIVDEAIRQAEIRSGGADWGKCSTFTTEARPGYPGQTVKDGAGVSSERWTDSDGEQATWLEVVEETLRSLGLKMRQRGGRVHVYDMHGLAYAANFAGVSREVEWNGERQDLGADRIYNRVKVTWGTYVRDGNLAEDAPWGDELPSANIEGADPSGVTEGECTYYTVPDRVPENMFDMPDGAGFTLWTKRSGRGISLGPVQNNQTRVMAEVPQLEGTEKQGVAVTWTNVGLRENEEEIELTRYFFGSNPKNLGGSRETMTGKFSTGTAMPLFTLEAIDLNPAADGADAILNVKLPLLLTWRLLPHSDRRSVGDSTGKQHDALWAGAVNFVFVPISLLWEDAQTGKTYAWQNVNGIKDLPPAGTVCMKATRSPGAWVEVNGAEALGIGVPKAYLAYYDPEIYDGGTGYKESTAFGGDSYAVNRPAVKRTAMKLSRQLADYEGQPVALPPGGAGKLTLHVLSTGWISAKRQEMMSGETNPEFLNAAFYDREIENIFTTNWVLCGMPEIRMERRLDAYERELDASDVEYELELNPRAAEELSIDVKCGTADETLLGARGAYVDPTTGAAVRTIRRGPNTDAAGMVLCATALSQYADRHTTLRGEAELDAADWMAYTERNQGERLFHASGEVQDVRMWTSEVTLVEFNEDKAI